MIKSKFFCKNRFVFCFLKNINVALCQALVFELILMSIAEFTGLVLFSSPKLNIFIICQF